MNPAAEGTQSEREGDRFETPPAAVSAEPSHVGGNCHRRGQTCSSKKGHRLPAGACRTPDKAYCLQSSRTGNQQLDVTLTSGRLDFTLKTGQSVLIDRSIKTAPGNIGTDKLSIQLKGLSYAFVLPINTWFLTCDTHSSTTAAVRETPRTVWYAAPAEACVCVCNICSRISAVN